MNPRVKDVKYESPHNLILTFTNNEVRQFDFSAYLHYPVYAPLKEEGFCYKVQVVNGTASWNNDIDFDPDTLHLDNRALVSLE